MGFRTRFQQTATLWTVRISWRIPPSGLEIVE